jgi:hypothetical protein
MHDGGFPRVCVLLRWRRPLLHLFFISSIYDFTQESMAMEFA